MADTSLIFNLIARDKVSKVLRTMREGALDTGTTLKAALGPAIVPVLAASSGAALGLAAAVGSAGVALGVFGAVTASAFTDVKEAATKVDDLNEKIELLGKRAELATDDKDKAKYLKQQAAAQNELAARLALLPPAQAKAVEGYLGMKNAWGDFVEKNSPTSYGVMAHGMNILKEGIGKLQPFYDLAVGGVKRLMVAFQGFVQGDGLTRMAQLAGPALHALITIVLNLGTVVSNLLGKFAGEGQGILQWLGEVTGKWAAWSSATGDNQGINQFFAAYQQSGPQVIALLAQLAQAATNIWMAVTPLAPLSFALASALASIVAAIPPQYITALVAGFIAYSAAMKVFAVVSAISTAAQWAFNIAQMASPTTWIILGIVALIAIIVVIATKTTWFQWIWDQVWGFMKMIGAWFAGPFVDFFKKAWDILTQGFNIWLSFVKGYVGMWVSIFRGIWDGAKWVIDKITSGFNAVISFFQAAPGRIAGALRNMFSPVWQGFRSAINSIIAGWNNLGFTIPSMEVFGKTVGGGFIGTPNIPYLNVGGHVQQSGLAVIHRGETVVPARVSKYEGGTGGATFVLKPDGSRASRVLLELLREAIRDKGGDPVKVLTPA